MMNKSAQISENPIVKDLLWRRTCKKYDPTKRISPETLQVILDSLRLSASSINSQPWKFIVLDSDDAKERMNQTFQGKYPFNQAHIFDSSQIILLAHNPRYTRDDYGKVVDQYITDQRIKPEDREMAFGAFRFAELNTDDSGYNGAWTKAQLYLALGNLLHVLARLKIASTPMEGIDVEQVNREFEKELSGYQCDLALAIGYSHEEDVNQKLPKSRLPQQDVIHII